MENSIGRQDSRIFLQPGRRLKILLFLDEKIYSGQITDFSNNGFGIELFGNKCPKEGEIFNKCYIGEASDKYSIDNLKIVNRRFDSGTLKYHIGVTIDSITQEDHLFRIKQYISQQVNIDDIERHKFRKMPFYPGKSHYSKDSIENRINWVQDATRANLDNIRQSRLNPEILPGNIENYIGSVQVPLGVAGPILINGTYSSGYTPIPIATTEGALISSITRGAHACNLSGGVNVHVVHQYMLRAPMFVCKDMLGAVNLERWIQNHLYKLREITSRHSSVAILSHIETQLLGENLHISLYYSTGDAAGQNMTTSCSWAICDWIENQVKHDASIGLKYFRIDANMSGDKKANVQNFLRGRGTHVIAECRIPKEILNKVLGLKVSAKKFARDWAAAEWASLNIGMMGSNANFANAIAGIFVATGQDIACVHESSIGVFKMREDDNDGLIVTAQLPSLVIGTIGGGTFLPEQQECLNLLNCAGQGKVYRLAEIIASTCLALDLSTLASIEANTFARAHGTVGKKKSGHISKSDLNLKLIKSIFDPQLGPVQSVIIKSLKNNKGILSTIAKERISSAYGLHECQLTLDADKDTGTTPANLNTILKIKASGTQLVDFGLQLIRLLGDDRLPGLYEAYHDIFGFQDCHIRELEFYDYANDKIKKNCPKIYGLLNNDKLNNDSRQCFAILMEDMSSYPYIDSIDNPALWDDKHILSVLDWMAEFHALNFNNYDEILEDVELFNPDMKTKVVSKILLQELFNFNKKRYPELFTASFNENIHKHLKSYEAQLLKLDKYHKTVCHNDLNTRNLCFRDDQNQTPIIYDWELAAITNPQRDLVEFLSFIITDDNESKINFYIDYYHAALEKETGINLDISDFYEVLSINALQFMLTRLNLYLLTQNLLNQDYLPRVIDNVNTILFHCKSQVSNITPIKTALVTPQLFLEEMGY